MVAGCIILPSGDIVIAAKYYENAVCIYNESGNYDKHIKINGNPYDLTLISPNHIAITHGYLGNTLDLVNLSAGVVELKIPTKKFSKKGSTYCCFGISYWDDKLYVIVQYVGIVVLDTTGTALDILAIDVGRGRNIVVFRDRIYYTNRNKNTIHCMNTVGQRIWVYKNKSIVKPSGLAVDSNLDLFVSGSSSNNIILIKRDGTASKVLLQQEDNLVKPKAMYLNRERRELLVCNESDRYAAVYKIV